MTGYPPQALANAAVAVEQVLGRSVAKLADLADAELRLVAEEAAAAALAASAPLLAAAEAPDWERAISQVRADLPPCPACGCRTCDDADGRECGCDAGCNDGSYTPGINVLLAAARQGGVAEGADRSAAWLAGPDGARALAELAGKLVADAVAAERQRIREEAVAVGATYQPCPCDPARGIGDPEHGPVPFADLIGGDRP